VGEQAGEVVVEAELLLGGGQGLVVDVELRCPLDDRVAPGDEDGLLVTGGDGDLVVLVRGDGLELQAPVGHVAGGAGGSRQGRAERGGT